MKTDVVSYVFDRLAATYGAAWDKSLGNAPLADVKTVWQDALDQFLHTDAAKRSILWALDNLPERPLNVVAFRALCRSAPAQVLPQLPEPRMDPERVAAELEKLGQVRSKVTATLSSHRDWAHALKAKDEANPKSVTQAVRMMYQATLKGNVA